MSKTATRKARQRNRYTWTIEINGGDRLSRTSKRILTYSKPPQEWDALDLAKVVRTMARMAAGVRKKKIVDRDMAVWFEGRDGGTEITVSPTFGAWACLRGHEMHRRGGGGTGFVWLNPEAIAVFVAMSQRIPSAHVDAPPMLPLDTRAFIKAQRRLLKDLSAADEAVRAAWTIVRDGEKGGA